MVGKCVNDVNYLRNSVISFLKGLETFASIIFFT
jgi:hypothetical protein